MADRKSRPVLRVDHFGPSEDYVGGMASVLTVLREHSVGAAIVMTHSTWVPDSRTRTLMAWVRSIWRVLTLPRGAVVHVHVSAKGSFVRKGVLLWVARLRGLRAAAWVHGSEFDAFARRAPWLVQAALRPAQAVTVLTPDAASIVRRLAPWCSVVELDNPVVLDDPATDVRETGQHALFAGEVGLRKGVDVLFAAWPQVRAKFPEATLTVAGPVADYEPGDVPGITLLGPVPGQQVRALIRSARVIVLPSRAEAMPMILLEAAACGRPFVATPVGSVESVADGAGIIVPIDAVDELAAAIGKVLGDMTFAVELGAAGYERAIARSPQAVGAKLELLYAGL